MKGFVEIFQSRVENAPNKLVFRSLSGNVFQNEVSYEQLLRGAWNLSKSIQKNTTGERVLLLFDNSVDFIYNFLACQLAGKVAVPAVFPRNDRYFEQLNIIIDDADCNTVVCAVKNKEKVTKGFSKIGNEILVHSHDLDGTNYGDEITPTTHDIAFLQYTSGSTGNPKGVVVSQTNLAHNQGLLQEMFGCDENSIILSWLPFYHDMGLIGNLLHTMYVGATCIIMSGAEVLQNPSLWLSAISTHQVTHSGGPNFIYDRCIKDISSEQLSGMDLSSWKVAFNGSEPIRTATVSQFIEKFTSVGFAPKAYQTCYGLAEATLLVSSGNPDLSEEMISSGKVCSDLKVIFLSETGQFSDVEGEVCIHGESVTAGYWNKDNTPYFVTHEGNKYLRTGDAGKLRNGNLLITGRLKEMIVIAGKNYYPYDLELAIAAQISSIENNGVVVSYIDSNEKEEALIFAEIKRTALKNDLNAIRLEVNKVLLEITGTKAGDIVLLGPRRLPRTSSGKLQRGKIKNQYLSNTLESLLQNETKEDFKKELQEIVEEIEKCPQDEEKLKDYLKHLISNKLSIPKEELKEDASLLDHGISSLNGVEIVHQINEDFEINLDMNSIMEFKDVNELHGHITNLLWIKTQPLGGEEITL